MNIKFVLRTMLFFQSSRKTLARALKTVSTIRLCNILWQTNRESNLPFLERDSKFSGSRANCKIKEEALILSDTSSYNNSIYSFKQFMFAPPSFSGMVLSPPSMSVIMLLFEVLDFLFQLLFYFN